jgi:hypothetical protein
MAAPVISATSSYLGFKRNESFAFQPAATGSPTTWAATTLPAGVTIDDETGLISGAIAEQGVYVFIVSAENGDGIGTREFTIGISSANAGTAVASEAAIDLVIDVVTRKVRLGLPGEAGEPVTPETLSVKFDDTVMFCIRFEKNGVQTDPDPSALAMVGKKYDPETILFESLAFEQITEGDFAKYNLPVPFSGDPLKAALADEEADSGTKFNPLLEIEWKRTVTHNAADLDLVSSTRNFAAELVRELNPN